jgi:hypothetical protein
VTAQSAVIASEAKQSSHAPAGAPKIAEPAATAVVFSWRASRALDRFASLAMTRANQNAE